LAAQLASDFNLEVELKSIILIAFRFFEFLHSQGPKATFDCRSTSEVWLGVALTLCVVALLTIFAREWCVRSWTRMAHP
jgi:hypothetical protein